MTELQDIEDEMRQHPDPVVSVPELADAMNLSDTHVRDQLRLLERAGAVESKDVGARATAWWHVDRVAPRHVAPEDHPDQSDLRTLERADDAHSAESESADRAVSEIEEFRAGEQTAEQALEVIDLPGRGTRQEQRQEAMRDLLNLLRENGDYSATELRETIYEKHETGYADATSFWKNCAGPALSTLRDEGFVDLVDGHDGIWRWQP